MDLSIIIPAFNAEKTIKRAIDSVLSQKTKYKIELIIIDDGSKDATLSIISKYKTYSNVKIISHENKGIGFVRTEGMKLASGHYISYLDADDELLPDSIGLYLSEGFKRDSDIVIFDSEFIYSDGKKEPYPAIEKHPGGRISPSEYYLSMPGPWNKIMKKSLFEDFGIEFPNGIWYEDLATIPVLAISAGRERLYYLKKTLHQYHYTDESITRGSGFKPKFADIIPAVENAVIYTKDLYRDESCYLAWKHFYRSFVWKFYPYKKYDLIHKMNHVFLKHFPKWYKNKLILREGLPALIYSYLFINEKFSILRLIKRS